MKTEIRINRASEKFEFVWQTHDGNQNVVSCGTLEQAVTYARGFTDGITAARNMVVIETMWNVPSMDTGKGGAA